MGGTLAAVVLLAVAVPWIASRRRRVERRPAEAQRGHAPAAALAVAIALLPAERVDWGRAMLGELEQIEGWRARWRFSLGCIGAVLRVPRSQGEPRQLIVGLVLAAGVGAAGLVTLAFVRYPGLRTGGGTWLAVALFVLVLASYSVATVALLRASPNAQLVARIALPTGVAIAVLPLLVVIGSSASTPVSSLLMILAFAVASLAAGIAGVRWGVAPAVGRGVVFVAAIVAGLTVFLVWVGNTLVDAGRPYDPGLVRDFYASGSRDLATYAVNDNLGSAMVLLLLVPVLVGTIGCAGVAFATRRGRSHTAGSSSASGSPV